jgi:hypothetical protein
LAKLNVTAFLTAGVAANALDSIGKQYEDGSGNLYLPIFAQPVFVFTASAEHLQRTRTRALSREVSIALYTKDMFATSNDTDNRAVVKAVAADGLDIVGIAFRAERKTFDKIINGLKLHS